MIHKYKAWHKKDKQFYVVWNISFNIRGDIVSVNDYSPEEVDLILFIGIKDIDKKDIYDGDILAELIDGAWTPSYYVKWSDDHCKFFLCDSEGDFDGDIFIDYDLSKMKVWGNIFQNPDFLAGDMND